MTVVPGGMQDCSDDHRLRWFDYFIHDAVREAVGVTPANVLPGMTAAIEQRIFCERVPNADNFFDKLRTKSRLPGLISGSGFRHILLHFRAELDPPLHRTKRERRRAFISSSGTAVAGF